MAENTYTGSDLAIPDPFEYLPFDSASVILSAIEGFSATIRTYGYFLMLSVLGPIA
jgi:hypothetical protein